MLGVTLLSLLACLVALSLPVPPAGALARFAVTEEPSVPFFNDRLIGEAAWQIGLHEHKRYRPPAMLAKDEAIRYLADHLHGAFTYDWQQPDRLIVRVESHPPIIALALLNRLSRLWQAENPHAQLVTKPAIWRSPAWPAEAPGWLSMALILGLVAGVFMARLMDAISKPI